MQFDCSYFFSLIILEKTTDLLLSAINITQYWNLATGTKYVILLGIFSDVESL